MIRIGVLCPSEIALRRFMPALQKIEEAIFVGIGVCTKEERFESDNVDNDLANTIIQQEQTKANTFINQYGGRVFNGYYSVVTSSDIDAVYIPLPPALHYRWAKLALRNGKHVLVEKPSTICYDDTNDLITIAKNSKLALHENYMFVFHNQLEAIDEIVDSGEIGDIRLLRISFGFPLRAANDFRYNKALGGGALIDAGGYTIKYATKLLGDSARIVYAQSNYISGFEVDMYGSAAFVNDAGVTAQIAFGMDNNYKCELEIWGSKGTLTTCRVLTAPDGFVPTAVIRKGNDEKLLELPSDDAFKKSIEHFLKCISDETIRECNYESMRKQAFFVDEFKKIREL